MKIFNKKTKNKSIKVKKNQSNAVVPLSFFKDKRFALIAIAVVFTAGIGTYYISNSQAASRWVKVGSEYKDRYVRFGPINDGYGASHWTKPYKTKVKLRACATAKVTKGTKGYLRIILVDPDGRNRSTKTKLIYSNRNYVICTDPIISNKKGYWYADISASPKNNNKDLRSFTIYQSSTQRKLL